MRRAVDINGKCTRTRTERACPFTSSCRLYTTRPVTMSDPALLFSPSQLSSLTDTSAEPSPPPQLTMPTRRKIQCYVAAPRLSPSIKKLYKQPPDYLGGDPLFTPSDLVGQDAVVGEYPSDSQGKPSHYFVRFKDGFARRVSQLAVTLTPFPKFNFL
jgi:hypothetical protein